MSKNTENDRREILAQFAFRYVSDDSKNLDALLGATPALSVDLWEQAQKNCEIPIGKTRKDELVLDLLLDELVDRVNRSRK